MSPRLSMLGPPGAPLGAAEGGHSSEDAADEEEEEALRIPPALLEIPVPAEWSDSGTDLEDAEVDAPVTLWRYDPVRPRDRGETLATLPDLEVRLLPDLEGPQGDFFLRAGEEFEVSEERRCQDGIIHLRLADGRGWVPTRAPGAGTLCEQVQGSPAPSEGDEAAADE